MHTSPVTKALADRSIAGPSRKQGHRYPLNRSTRRRIATLGVTAAAVLALQGTASGADRDVGACTIWHPQTIASRHLEHSWSPQTAIADQPQHTWSPDGAVVDASLHPWHAPTTAAEQHAQTWNPRQASIGQPLLTWSPAVDLPDDCLTEIGGTP